jgi:hypothetical protein
MFSTYSEDKCAMLGSSSMRCCVRSVTFPFLVICAGAAVSPLDAQVIRGTVFDRANGEPVQTAFVVLLDEHGARAGAVLTGDDGRFIHRVPATGRYRVRVERIGFRSETSDPIEVGESEVVPVRLGISSQPIPLGEISAEGERRCRISREEGHLISDLWDEVRKVLQLAVWIDTQSGLNVQARNHERVLDFVTGAVLEERVQRWGGFSRAPYFALSGEKLAEDGYVIEEPDGSHRYFGLSPETILSRPFEDTHCFRAQRPSRGQDRAEIGLAFEPAPGHRPPDVKGVLWIERATGKLRRVEYTYTRHLHPIQLPAHRFGGRMEFRELDNGAWIVDDWWIRMPQFERIVNLDDLPRGTLVRGGIMADAERDTRFRQIGLTIREAGGRILSVALSGTESRRTGSGRIEGVLFDSISGDPLRDATVYLSGTHHQARTDSAGHYRLPGLAEGEWIVAFHHPALDGLGIPPDSRTIRLAAGEARIVDLTTPSAATVLGSRCPRTEEIEWVVGFVLTPDDVPIIGARVLAEWDVWRREGDRAEFSRTRHERGAVTDAAGAYAICGVRPGTVRLAADLWGEEVQIGRRTVVVPAREGTRADFRMAWKSGAAPPGGPALPAEGAVVAQPSPAPVEDTARALRPPPVPMAVQGRLLTGAEDQPVAGATVRLLRGETGDEELAAVLTDAEGRFVLPAPAVGSYRLSTERIGYASVTTPTFDLIRDDGLEVELRVAVEAIPLAPLTIVSERPARLDNLRMHVGGYFERERTWGARGMGFAHFLDREAVRRRNASRITDLVRDLPGVRVEPNAEGGTMITLRSVDGTGNRCIPLVFLDGAPAGDGADIDLLISAWDIAAVEVYPGQGIPAQFMRGRACGAIVLWTGA